MQKNKIKFKAKNIENTVRASSDSLHQQINCKCVGANCVRPNSNGITIIALIITIIVMLLLIGVTVSTVLKGDLFNLAKKASVETRASMVEEKVAEWKSNKKIDEYLEENSNTQSLEELLNDLETQQLITNEERKEIEEKMQVKIGDKEILFYELPDGYTRLEYLESTGTQFLRTDIIPTNSMSICLDAQETVWENDKWFLGAMDSKENNNVIAIGMGRDGFQFVYNSRTFYRLFNQSRNKHSFILTPSEVFVDDLKLTISNEGRRNNVTINIFGLNWGQRGTYGNIKAKIYFVKIFDMGERILDLIPCLDSNSRPCMYDTVTGKTFYNQGTGEFIAGYKN